ncbi:MAG: hypothetical protein ABI878_09455 [Acidobacteriota bacterium]
MVVYYPLAGWVRHRSYRFLKPKRAETPEMRVNVVDLAAEFKKDIRWANSKYAGRTVAVTGTVDMRVAYATTVGFKTPDKGFGVQCFFKKRRARIA